MFAIFVFEKEESTRGGVHKPFLLEQLRANRERGEENLKAIMRGSRALYEQDATHFFGKFAERSNGMKCIDGQKKNWPPFAPIEARALLVVFKDKRNLHLASRNGRTGTCDKNQSTLLKMEFYDLASRHGER